MRTGNYILLGLIVFLIFSCKKSKDTVTPVVPETVIPVDYEMIRICKPEWLIYKVDVGGTDFWQIPGIFQTCMKDDTYRFYRDSVLTTFENKNICTGNSDSIHSRWNFMDGRKKIEGIFLGNRDTADVVKLTDSTMQLYVNYMGNDANIFFKKK